MPNEDEKIEQNKIDAMEESFNAKMKKFDSLTDAKIERLEAENRDIKLNKVNEIVELATKAGKEKEYTPEYLNAQSDETLNVVKNSLNDLIKVQEEKQTDDQGIGGLNEKRSNSSAPLSQYDKTSKIVDMISHSFGLPILSDEDKLEVKYEHNAQGLNY